MKLIIKNPIIKNIVKHLPTLLLVIIILYGVVSGRRFDVESLWLYTPRGYLAAAIFFLVVYVIKSLSFLIPIVLVYIAVGTIFPPLAALIINLIGAAIVMTIPYVLGYNYGAGLWGTLLSRFPKVEKFIKSREHSSWFVSCLPRTIIFVPLKTVSAYLGSLKIPFSKYLLGSLLGLFPLLVSVTLIGSNITEPKSPEFIVSAIVAAISAWSSIAVYVLLERRSKRIRHRDKIAKTRNFHL